MKLALLGGTSLLARNFAINSLKSDFQLTLFARNPKSAEAWFENYDQKAEILCASFDTLNKENYSAIINFVGTGNPLATEKIAEKIIDITDQYDQLALNYIRHNSACKYIFLSSGAVYGGTFKEPASFERSAAIEVNDLGCSNWYGSAKLRAEILHRALDLPIIDLRVFNFVSRYQDLDSRFLITDAIKAIKQDTKLFTSPENMTRDYLHPSDFYQILDLLLRAPTMNAAFDCYSAKVVDKFSLLDALHQEFGLSYEITPTVKAVESTGMKQNYYSTDRRLNKFVNYQPKFSSIEAVFEEVTATLSLI
jgi:nucleoside-diphosphate-sugar epimerase